ncbi:MAG: phosphotransferase [Chitinispirillia bacterium]|nr:phosphotransferase [Chitinispirillia bacterium]MCL2268400.1 phosphotransferase [Chitinispirillia bacterium]
MELTSAVVRLTSAQVGFLESSIQGFNMAGWKVELAGQAASTRRFFRVTRPGGAAPASGPPPHTYILVEWDSRDEDWPRFLEIEAYVSPSLDFLPKVYGCDPMHGLILEEDLGATTLKNFQSANSGNDGMVEDMYRVVIDALCRWHRLDVSGCPAITSRAMDLEVFLWESGYFAQHCVTGYLGKEAMLTAGWEAERQRIARSAAEIRRVCIHRDFQSENVLVHGGRIRFVDFQGARLGAPYYDVASLLFDPYVDLDYGMIERLLDYYLTNVDSPGGRGDFYICAAQRLMQALGAYGNLTLHKGKPQYGRFIRPALSRLAYVFKFLPDYPVAGQIVNSCLP